MSKHTPGPWCVRDLPTAQRYIGPSNDGGASSVALVLARVNLPDEQIAADAKLVAAAPELLAALNRLMGGTTTMQDAADANKQARAAIAKAEGDPS